MNDILNTLGAALNKAVDTMETGLNVAAQEQKAKQAYIALGKLYCRNAKNGTALTGPEFEALVNEAETALAAIAKIKSTNSVNHEDYEQV